MRIFHASHLFTAATNLEQVSQQMHCMQEYFVDDLCELLLYVGQTAPKLLEGLQLEEVLVFMVVFMGSPGYVQNPFLRSRISEV